MFFGGRRSKPFRFSWLNILLVITGFSTASCGLNPFASPSPEFQRRTEKLNCDGLQLDQQIFTSEEFKRLLECLNSNGQVQPVVDLARKVSEEELQPIVEFVKRTFIDDPDLTTRLSDSIDDYDSLFRGLSKIYLYPEFVRTSMLWVGEAYGEKSDPELIDALQKWSTKVDDPKARLTVDLILSFIESPAFRSLSESIYGNREKLYKHIPSLAEFIHQSALDPEEVEIFYSLMMLTASGSLFEFSDRAFGKDPTTIAKNVSDLASAFRSISYGNGEGLEALTTFFHEVNKEIVCLGGAKSIESGAKMALEEIQRSAPLDDLATYYDREFAMNLSSLNSYCELHPDYHLYWLIKDHFVESGHIFAATRMVQNMPDDVLDFFVQLLSDTGSESLERSHGIAENSGRIKVLIPLLVDLAKSGFWEDFFLLFSLPRDEEREQLQWMLTGSEFVGVLVDRLSQVNPVTMLSWFYALQVLLESDEAPIREFLHGARIALRQDPNNPVIHIFNQLLKEAQINDDFIRSFMGLAKHDEFTDVLAWLENAIREGELKPILTSLLGLISGQTESVSLSHVKSATFFEPLIRHRLTRKSLPGFKPVYFESNASSTCRGLEISSRYPVERTSIFGTNFFAMVDCMSEVDDAYALSLYERELGQVFRLNIPMYQLVANSLNLEEKIDFSNRFYTTAADGRLRKFFNGASFWIGDRIEESPIDPVVQLTELFWQEKKAFKGFEKLLANAVSDSDWSVFDDWVDRYDETQGVQKPGFRDPSVESRTILNQLVSVECVTNRTQLRIREGQIRKAFFESHSNDESIYRTDLSEIRPEMDSVLDSVAFPSKSKSDYSLGEALLNILRQIDGGVESFEVSSRRFSPSAVADWIVDRATDTRLVPLIEPGDSKPKVKWVSTLDQFELILKNANIQLPQIGILGVPQSNLAFVFLERFAHSWGDLPRNQWPLAIRKKFSGRKRPNTLRETLFEIDKILEILEREVGYPKEPKCFSAHASLAGGRWRVGNFGFLFSNELRARIFNLRQVMQAAWENLPGADHSHAGGFQLVRNILFEFHQSTQKKHRNLFGGEKNHFTQFIRLVELGAFRQLTQFVNGLEVDREVLSDALSALTSLSRAPGLLPEIYPHLQNEDLRDLFWSSLDRSQFSGSFDLNQAVYAAAVWSKVQTPQATHYLVKILSRYFEELEGLNLDDFDLKGEMTSDSHGGVLGRVYHSLDPELESRLSELLTRQFQSDQAWREMAPLVGRVLREKKWRELFGTFLDRVNLLELEPDYLAQDFGGRFGQVWEMLAETDSSFPTQLRLAASRILAAPLPESNDSRTYFEAWLDMLHGGQTPRESQVAFWNVLYSFRSAILSGKVEYLFGQAAREFVETSP